MRLNKWLAGLIVGTTAVLAATSASAFGLKRWDPSVAPEGYGHHRTIRHWVYHPTYKHVYHVAHHGDPYAYRYVRRGYYPYTGSHYWVPAEQMRYRYRTSYHGPKFRYHASWGLGKAHHPRHVGHDYRPTK